MNKSELVDAIAAKTGGAKVDATKMVDAFIETVSQSVAKGEPVTLVGFGTFKAVPRAARTGKNPKTGEVLKIPATVVPKFSPGSGFKEEVATKKGKKSR